MGTLALGYTVRCYLRPLETLTPDTGHAWYTQEEGPSLAAGPFPQLVLSPKTEEMLPPGDGQCLGSTESQDVSHA